MEFYGELAGMMGDCALTLSLLKEKEPEIMNHLNETGSELFLNNLLYQWYVSLFVQYVKHDVFLAVWDAMFIDGNIVIFRATLAIISFYKNEILNMESMEELSDFFENKIIEFDDVENLTKALLEPKVIFEIEDIMKGREQYLPKVIENIKKTKGQPDESKKNDIPNKEIECDRDWPFCVNDINKIGIQHVLVLKMLTPVKVEDNFYDEHVNDKIKAYKEKLRKKNENKNKNQYNELMTDREKFINKVEIFSELLIERKKHECNSKKATSEEIMKSKESGGSYDSFDSFPNMDSNYKKDILTSSMMVSSYFEQNLHKAKEISNIIGKIDKSDLGKSKKISLVKSRGKKKSNK